MVPPLRHVPPLLPLGAARLRRRAARLAPRRLPLLVRSVHLHCIRSYCSTYTYIYRRSDLRAFHCSRGALSRPLFVLLRRAERRTTVARVRSMTSPPTSSQSAARGRPRCRRFVISTSRASHSGIASFSDIRSFWHHPLGRHVHVSLACTLAALGA